MINLATSYANFNCCRWVLSFNHTILSSKQPTKREKASLKLINRFTIAIIADDLLQTE